MSKSMMDTFSIRLRNMRKKQQLDRKTLAELCGLSKDMIGQYERGERLPSARSLMALADYFDVSVDYLLGREK